MTGSTAGDRPVLLLATTNPGKLREIRDLLQGVPFEVRSLEGMADIAAPEETGATFEANALLKARYYAEATGLLAVADDSGLEIDAMDGRPGVLSARYPGATYEERFTNIWREMAASGRTDWRARFVCAIALAMPDAVLFERAAPSRARSCPRRAARRGSATTRSSSARSWGRASAKRRWRRSGRSATADAPSPRCATIC